jgi:hypothetical protein
MTADAFDTWVRMAQTEGIVLDAQTLAIIAQPSTRADMLAALYPDGARDGNAYFVGVTAALFPAVIMATMDGMAGLPADVFAAPGATR